jgi:HEAT repeat protein
MGLLDLFSKKGGGGALQKHAARVANKRAQAVDRWEAIQALRAAGTPEAVEALLVRFSFRVDPSITDQEEKDAVCEAVVAAGDAAVEPLRRFLRDTESVAWALKCLDEVLPTEGVTEDLLAILADMDTEYERDPQKKIQVLAALEERRNPRVLEAVRPFLDDMNETARFHAVAALLAQEGAEEAVQEALLETYLRDDSARVRARILEGFVARGWKLDKGKSLDAAREKLPRGYVITSKGEVRKKQ